MDSPSSYTSTPTPSEHAISWYPITPTSLSTSFDEQMSISMSSVRSSPNIQDQAFEDKKCSCQDLQYQKSPLQITIEQLPSMIVYYFWDPLNFLSSPERGPRHQYHNSVLIVNACEANFVPQKDWLVALGFFIATFSLWATQLYWLYEIYTSIQWYHWLYLAAGIMLELKFYNNRFGFATSSSEMSIGHIVLTIGAIMIEIHLGILALGAMTVMGINGLVVPYLLVTPSRLFPTYTFKPSKIKLGLSNNDTVRDFQNYVKRKWRSMMEEFERQRDRTPIFKNRNTTYDR